MSAKTIMESISELIGKITQNTFDIGTSCWVDVTHINNPHNFYIRPRSYKTHMPVLQARGEHLEISQVNTGDIVIFKSKIQKCYARGRVVYIDGDKEFKCNLFAIDYGCFERDVPLSRIRKPLNAFDVPPLATHCLLADCKPHGNIWDDQAIEAMKDYVGKERAKIVIRGKTADAVIVELYNTCPDDIATLLALTGYTNLGYGENVISRFPLKLHENHYYRPKELQVDDVLHVRVQSGTSLKEFYVAQLSDYKKFLKDRAEFTHYAKSQDAICPDDLKVNKPIGVYYDRHGKYERGIVKEITEPENRAKVQLVDWGIIVEVDVLKMKPMLERHFQSPVVAIHCSADESQVWDNGLHRFLYPGFEFLIKIKMAEDNLESPNIVNISPLSYKKRK